MNHVSFSAAGGGAGALRGKEEVGGEGKKQGSRGSTSPLLPCAAILAASPIPLPSPPRAGHEEREGKSGAGVAVLWPCSAGHEGGRRGAALRLNAHCHFC
jgi:hypothetical protein